MLRSFLTGLALAIALPPSFAATPAAVKPAAQDWTRTVVATPEGGFRMGNPNAPVKLVEYGSLTCPHCAHFAAEGVPAVLAEVRKGRVSYEFRNYVRDAVDLAAAQLSRCVGPQRYFETTAHIFSTQEQWIDKLRSISEEDQKQIDSAPMPQKLARLAAGAGFPALIGVPPAGANSCLADEKATDRLVGMVKTANAQFQPEGTPTFLLNGKKLAGVFDWAALQPHLASGK